MSESSGHRPRVIVFHQNGELSEFVSLLTALALRVDEQTGALLSTSEMEDACLVIVPGRRLVETGTTGLAFWPPTIAVIDDATRTLVGYVNRLGVEMLIRRPIHPRALRLLLLHQLYSGPERRARKRVLVGHPIKVGKRLFKSAATLLELSKSGARIELKDAPDVGSPISIVLGKELTRGKPLRLEARVIRCIRPSGPGKNARGTGEIGVHLLGARKHAEVIQGLLDRFAIGPASLPVGRGRPTPTPGRNRRPAPARSAVAVPPAAPTRQEQAGEPGASTPLTPEHAAPPMAEPTAMPVAMSHDDDSALGDPTPASPQDATGQEPDATTGIDLDPEIPMASEALERRRDPRLPYDQRIVALGEEASRVLVGRDLSHGGMRIEMTADLEIGRRMRLALHSGLESLVVTAEVQRDDGDEGIVLRFRDVSPSQHETLARILADSRPYATDLDESALLEESGFPIVLGEMLEALPTGSSDSSSPHRE